MTETSGAGLRIPPQETPRRSSWNRPGLITGAVFGAGFLVAISTASWSASWPIAQHQFVASSAWPYVVFVLLAVVAEIIYVPVRHGDGNEELTFFEVLVIGGVLVFVPVVALTAPLVGFAVAELILRRPMMKILFNLGSYAMASSALLVVYALVSGTNPRFSLISVGALVLGAGAFAAINLLLLGWVLQSAEGVSVRELVREQSTLSLGMALGSVGVATTAIALAINAPALTPFALLPAAALWYAYRSSAQHGDALERNRWLIAFGTAVSTPASPSHLVPEAADAIRRIFAADQVRVALPGAVFATTGSGSAIAESAPTPLDAARMAEATESVRAIGSTGLPDRWLSGYVVRLDIAGQMPGALMLGTTKRTKGIQRILPWARRDWTLVDVDAPVLGALAASLAGAVRAGQHLAALTEETAKLTAVVDHATDGIAVVDSHLRVLMWSPAMTTITGVSREAATAGVRSDSFAWDDPVARLSQAARAVESAAAGQEQSVRILRSDAEERELAVSVVWIEDAGVIDSQSANRLAILTVRDITRERRVERMKSDFIATVSHELRTPITPIKGYAQLLASRWQRMSEAKRAEVLSTIVERADHLTRLVDDLLLASRVSDSDSARLAVEITAEDLAVITREAAAMFPDLSDRIAATGGPVIAKCDRVRTVQCLANLIGNAAKYSDPGSAIGVEIGYEDRGTWATVEVIDHGRGIPADELDKVFERFYRVEDPMTMTTGGSGLGLFISRELARAMGGDIDARSELGSGSTFRLRLKPAERRGET